MRKFISVLLALMLVLSTATVAFSAYNVVDADAPDLAEEMADYDGTPARVYFQMPNGENGFTATEDVYVHHPEELDDDGNVVTEAYDELVITEGSKAPTWFNDYNLADDGNHYAGMYWWDNLSGIAPNWPGYRMEIENAEQGIYYGDIPGDGDTVSFIFNNGVDGGTDTTQEIYYYAAQTVDMNMEGAYEGDYDTLWGDTYNEFDFDGCIYVIDPDQVSINAFSGKQTCGGNWYFYYGNGCYGSYRTDADEFTSAEDCCLNPDHYVDGVHVGYHEDEPTPTEAPETAAPETAAPETAAPETAAPETAAPETAAPETQEPAPEDTYIVAGNAAAIFGVEWNGTAAANTMTKGDDGVYSIEYTVDAAMEDVQLKAVKNGADWIGDATGNNVTFDLTGAGTFTVYCDGEKTWVEGDIVKFNDVLVVDSVSAVGNGSADGDNWLNNVTWDPAAEANHMTEVSDGVYEISYTLGEYDTSDPEFKFAINDAWTHSFGIAEGVTLENGVATDAAYNGNNIKIEGLTAGTTITMQLDLTAFDFASKTGAKMTITWGDAPIETVAPETAAPETQAPETVAPQPTEAPKTLKPNTYYLYGTIASKNQDWTLDPELEMIPVEDGLYKIENIQLAKAELGVDQFGNPIKNSDPAGPEIIGDHFKVVISSKRGTSVAGYWPDGVENDRTVAEDGVYTIWFRPNGDGDPADGWIRVYVEGDPEGNGASHGCTKGGYMYKFEKTGDAPIETQAPETAAPETQAPETQAPETAAPETQAPETEPPVSEDTYIVAGNTAAIFGVEWNGTAAANTMTKGDDGIYSIEYTVDAAMEDVQLKAVKNGADWIGDATGNNVTFDLTGAGTFTVYCDGEKTWVEGDIVKFNDVLVVDSVSAVGNGSADGDNWLNNVAWDPAAEANHMNEVADGVYEISYTLGEFDTSDPEFKFAINDAWTHNFGLAEGAAVENGVATDAAYNGNNIKLEGLTAGTTITMQLDLSAFDFASKTGAKMTITWNNGEPVETYILGDVDGDGEVTSADAALIQRYDAQMSLPEGTVIANGDVNGDGEIDILDVTLIQRYVAKMKVKFPIGEEVPVAA